MFDVGTSIIKGGRNYQDDSFFITDPYATETAFSKLNSLLLCLADGVGGEAAGSIASKIVCRIAVEHIQKTAKEANAATLNNIPNLFTEVLPLIRKSFRKTLRENEHYKGMATTMLMCLIECSHLYWISVGDSRLILVRNGKFQALNEDHSYGAHLDEMVAKGDIKVEEAKDCKVRHYLLSYVDGGDIKSLDLPQEPHELQINDVLLLATDGINSLSDEEIGAILNAPAEAQTLAEELTQTISAKQVDYQDNSTVIVLKMIN